MTLAPLTIALLAGVALAAGIVDAIAGGGGLITLPALLAAGVPPHLALGTNKGQSVFGSGAALLRFLRGGRVDRKLARATFPLGLLGSLCGAALVLWIRPDALRPLVIVLLCVAAVFLAIPRPKADPSRAPARRPLLAASLIALALGAYDGFFGPGCGTFLIVGFVAVLGRTLDAASADAKVVNFASNLAAVAIFGSRGAILWNVALPMAAGQALGATLGAHLTVRGGERLVRPVVLVVVAALVLKLMHDLLAR